MNRIHRSSGPQDAVRAVVNIRVLPPLARYAMNEITGCWLWLGAKDKNGYARHGRVNAHRFYYESLVGPVPDGWDVDHLCKRRDCVNPEHLEAVTEAENIRRSTPIVEYAGKNFAVCKAGHLMTPENTYLHKRGNSQRRSCRECSLERARAARESANPDRKVRGPYKTRIASVKAAS